MSPKRLAQSQADMAEGKFVTQDPANVAPVTVWLCSPANTDVTGRIFSQSGSRLTVFSSFHPSDVSRKVTAELCVSPLTSAAMVMSCVQGAEISKEKERWEVGELSDAMPELLAMAGPAIGTLSQQMANGARL